MLTTQARFVASKVHHWIQQKGIRMAKATTDQPVATTNGADDEEPAQPQQNTQPQSPSDVERQELSQAARLASARSATPDPKVKSDSNLQKLLSLTDYKASDVVGYNPDTMTIVTSNGGKYILRRNGKAFRRISGPLAPSETATEEEEEE
jgi:hypothetical protein